MKALTTNGLTKLIQLIKSTFIPNTDVETTTEINIDNTPTQSSTNLVTSGGVYDAIAASGDVEWAEYGVTTAQQILDWVDAGKTVMVERATGIQDEKFFYTFDAVSPPMIVFICVEAYKIREITVRLDNNYWSDTGGNHNLQPQIPAGTAGNVITYTGTAGSIGSATLATVATSGSFADLQNKPTTLSGYGITDGAKTDLSNLTSDGKEVCANMAMPSARYVDLTLGAALTTYTAPADGYMDFVKQGSNGEWIMLYNQNYFEVDGVIYNQGYARIFIPCKKGDTITVNYNASGSYSALRFYYANGEA